MLFSRSVVSDSWQPHGWQRCWSPPSRRCPSPSPEFAQVHVHCIRDVIHILWHPLLLPLIFHSIRPFSRESSVCIRWPMFLYRLLYQNLMVTANWKSTLDTQKQKRNPNTTLKLVIKSWEQKKKGRKIIYKTKSNIIKNGNRQWEFVIWLGTQTWVELCNNLEGWDWERSRRMV